MARVVVSEFITLDGIVEDRAEVRASIAVKRLFADATSAKPLRPTESRPAGETLILVYEPASDASEEERA